MAILPDLCHLDRHKGLIFVDRDALTLINGLGTLAAFPFEEMRGETMHFPFRCAACCALAVATLSASVADANLVIVPTYDSTVTSRGDAASIESAFAYASQQYSNLFADNITLNITVAASSQAGLLGKSSFNLSTGYTYSDVRNALIADAKTSNDQKALANNLPVADPTHGGGFAMPFAQEKALGLTDPNDPTSDGTFTFGTGFNYTYDSNNRAVPGSIDFIGVAEHEISEIMGRTTVLDHASAFVPYDLMRYTSSGRSLSGSDIGVYFSIDGGATSLKMFNAPGNGGDIADWASGSNDAYNAFGTTGAQNDITGVDMRAMDVIGYDLVPEPTSLILFGCALFPVLGASRRSRRCVTTCRT